jgi:hypothetical protein
MLKAATVERNECGDRRRGEGDGTMTYRAETVTAMSGL